MKTMQREVTGRMVLVITLMAFAVIISVNLLLAFQAVRTFPGLEVANSYVASQNFDRERQAQQALGWTVTPDYSDGVLSIAIRDAAGQPVKARSMSATVGRPTQMRDDVTPEFVYEGGVYRARLTLAPGHWNIHMTAVAEDGTQFRQRLDHYNGERIQG